MLRRCCWESGKHRFVFQKQCICSFKTLEQAVVAYKFVRKYSAEDGVGQQEELERAIIQKVKKKEQEAADMKKKEVEMMKKKELTAQ